MNILNNDNNIKKEEYKDRYALTFGENAIQHIGGNELGNGRRKVGFSVKELKELANRFENTEFYSLNNNNIKESDIKSAETIENYDAAIIIIRNGANLLFNLDKDSEINTELNISDLLYKEQKKVKYDNTYYDTRRGRMLNKRARYNIVFGDKYQEQCFIRNNKKLTPIEFTSKEFKIRKEDILNSIESFDRLPLLLKFKNLLYQEFGEKANKLNAEGNHYFHEKSYIGWHGDIERKIVICLSLGKSNYIRFAWRGPKSSVNREIKEFKINHGDIYIMSEKATGFDWKLRSKWRLVHSANSN